LIFVDAAADAAADATAATACEKSTPVIKIEIGHTCRRDS